MKKIFLIIMISVVTFSFASAQTEVTPEKDYSVYFPKQGDFALGADMAYFVKFVGNTIFNNGMGDPAYPGVNAFQSDFFGKYFLTENQAVRARLGIGIDNSKIRNFVQDDNKLIFDPFSDAKVVDTRIQRMSGAELGVGMELRRSLWRLQGYVGGEVFFGYNRQKLSYEYGNEVTSANQTPTSTAFNFDPISGTSENIIGNKRVLSYNGINQINYGLGAFVGVDYFISRNISLGFEFKLEGRATRTGEATAITETWKSDQLFVKEELMMPVSTSFALKPVTYFSLMFYF